MNRTAHMARIAMLAVMLAAGCGPTPAPPVAGDHPSARAPAPYVDISEPSGVDFLHRNGARGEYYFPEIQGPGVALLDYDGDGDLDLYLVQGGVLPAEAAGSDEPAGGRLYRNQWIPEGQLRFIDVTNEVGLRANSYGIGVAVEDFDRDGDPDLYLTNFGENQLWRNDGAAGFSEVAAAAGVADARWSHSASFTDVDRDGWPDLWVANYVDFRLPLHKRCADAAGATDYCGPTSFAPQADRLYRNRGDGSFEEISDSQGISSLRAAGLGVIAADFDGNGWPDIYVANDDMHNHLWMNQDGRLSEDALLRGVAVNARGETEASMGITVADFDADGDEDIFITHLREETNTLYVNDGQGFFSDQTGPAGLAAPSIGFTGFGTAFVDIDNDGLLDLVAANGAVRAEQEQVQAGSVFPYRQRNQVFHFDGQRFTEIGASDGPFALQQSSRGLAVGDLDNDGDADLVISNDGDRPQLLRNTTDGAKHWLGLDLRLGDGRVAIGARAVLIAADGRRRQLLARRDGSYLSSSDPRVRFGLGDAGASVVVQVQWPDGSSREYPDLAVDRYHRLTP
ncbi:MAG: CRTAC1 family protein [Gammaproteobacteria bacterium]|nr:CRTAC1 family protein [Gammaproteobacteria bacterium]